MQPQIIVPDFRGAHNAASGTVARLKKAQGYRDLSTVAICPTRGKLDCIIVQALMALARPMNQKFIGPIFMRDMEVGAAYEAAIDMLVAHPDLSKFAYVLTIEEDNAPPPDGLMKLYEAIEGGVDGTRYDSVAGLYYTKGECGQPMIYGDPTEPLNFRPQVPKLDSVQECHGTGMGFTLIRMSVFTSGKLTKPYFRTVQEGGRYYTQDLYFYEQARKAGFRVASDNRVKVGHYDEATRTLW